MLNYQELVQLKTDLEKGNITLEQAKESYWRDHSGSKRSWHTKDWKRRRAEVIKDHCQICGSKESMTLQHLSHPKKYHQYESEVTKEFTKEIIESEYELNREEFKHHIITNFEYTPTPLCPSCNSRKPNERMRKTPKYRCGECKSEFDEPTYLTATDLINMFFTDENTIEVRDKCFTSKDQWRNKYNLNNARYWFQRKRVESQNSSHIKRIAFLRFINDNIKYLSFEDTITACKKCAFNSDMNEMELCPKCSVNYKGIKYQSCIQCLPSSKSRIALESIRLGKEMHELHKKLGID